MRNRVETSFLAFIVIVVAIIGCIGTVAYYVVDVQPEKAKTVQTRLPWDSSEETETEIVFEEVETEEIVFEEVETEDTIVHDTSGVSPKMSYTEDELLWLARIVWNEAGSDFCSDEHQQAVASVVMNRVESPLFPDTVQGVISQGWYGECPLQYAVGGEERFYSIVPTERAIENARYVLENGSVYPGAIWQAEFPQGNEIVAEFAYPEIYSTVTYICK